MLNRSTDPNEQSESGLGLQDTRVVEPRELDCQSWSMVLLTEGQNHKTEEGGTKPIIGLLQVDCLPAEIWGGRYWTSLRP